jgi:hypothetical protein
MLKKITKSFFILIIVALLGGCKERMDIKSDEIERDMAIIRDEGIKALDSKKVFFGHASVGYNVIEGIENIKANSDRFKLITVQELKENVVADKPGIYHAKNGKNSFPKTKVEAFRTFLEENKRGSQFDIAFFKFCYVDIHKESNVQEIFDYYVENSACHHSSLCTCMGTQRLYKESDKGRHLQCQAESI